MGETCGIADGGGPGVAAGECRGIGDEGGLGVAAGRWCSVAHGGGLSIAARGWGAVDSGCRHIGLGRVDKCQLREGHGRCAGANRSCTRRGADGA